MEIFYYSRRCCNTYFWIYAKYNRYNAVNYSTLRNTSPIFYQKIDEVKTKLSAAQKWYENFTGIDEVQAAQNKVIEAQERFASAQEKRREVTMELNDLKSKIKDLQEELSAVSKGEERFIGLITKEHKLLKEEIRLTDKFNLYDREERELFTTLTSAVKNSQEKERIQSNKTKYLSIIGSILGAFLGIIGSTINNKLKHSEFKKMILKLSEDGRVNSSVFIKHLEEASKNYQEINKRLIAISKDVEESKTVILNTKPIQQSLRNIEKKLNLKSSDDVTRVDNSGFANELLQILTREDVTYALMSVFGVFVLYKLFC